MPRILPPSMGGVASLDGWTSSGETWSYASADAPTFTFTIPGDQTGKYSAGMRIKLTQTTAKYFIITAVAYGAPNTTVTVYGGTDYTLTDDSITNPYYSAQKAPHGFPVDPTKWSVVLSDTGDREQSSPSAGVWYNLGSLSLSVPIGVWNVETKVVIRAELASAGAIAVNTTLSTANNSESDTDFTTYNYYNSITVNTSFVSVRKVLTLASKTVYYLNARTPSGSITLIRFNGTSAATVIRAVCAYL